MMAAARRCTPDQTALLSTLRSSFGLPSFRPNQLEAITCTLQGKDVLLVLPTGGGKSLAYQLPALAVDGCFTVVVSPLIALAQDQVRRCDELGIDAQIWNSQVSDAQKASIFSDLISDEPCLRLLFTTPEALRTPKLLEALQEAHQQQTLCSFAIDEAHCVSEWGHDFRPAYLELALLRSSFPGVPIIALTATCTARVQQGILECLGLREAAIIKASFNRPNIAYEIRHKELIGNGQDEACLQNLITFVTGRRGECGIIYARLRSTCDSLTSVLSSADVEAACYHAGKDAAQRRKVQREWSEGAVDVVVATIAFGMGIDKPDVRWVVHWDPPTSLEGLYQETGRGGRDGLPAQALLYVRREELDTMAAMEKGCRRGCVAEVAGWAMGEGCRRKALLAYFGEQRGRCNPALGEQQCDYCAAPGHVARSLARLEELAAAAAARGAGATAAAGASSGGGDSSSTSTECTGGGVRQEEEDDAASGGVANTSGQLQRVRQQGACMRPGLRRPAKAPKPELWSSAGQLAGAALPLLQQAPLPQQQQQKQQQGVGKPPLVKRRRIFVAPTCTSASASSGPAATQQGHSPAVPPPPQQQQSPALACGRTPSSGVLSGSAIAYGAACPSVHSSAYEAVPSRAAVLATAKLPAFVAPRQRQKPLTDSTNRPAAHPRNP